MNQTSRLENFPISFFAVIMGLAGFQILAALFLGLLTLIVAYLIYKTGLAVSRRKVCQPE